VAYQKILKIGPELFGDLKQASQLLGAGDSGEPLVRSADKDLYCLIRSDILLVDLSTAGYGEQGLDVLFGHIGGMPIIGITDRFQNAPSLFSRLDCLICPDSVGQIVHAIELFGGMAKGSASSESNESPQQQPMSATTTDVNKGFADSVLRAANVEGVDDDDGSNQVS
jgi:hypothetical protein